MGILGVEKVGIYCWHAINTSVSTKFNIWDYIPTNTKVNFRHPAGNYITKCSNISYYSHYYIVLKQTTISGKLHKTKKINKSHSTFKLMKNQKFWLIILDKS